MISPRLIYTLTPREGHPSIFLRAAAYHHTVVYKHLMDDLSLSLIHI